MGRKKLRRLSELENFDNIIESSDQPEQGDFQFYGTWAKDHFKNRNPITLELACGKGAYTIALAKKHPDRNFIGIDIKGPRLWSGCVAAQESRLNNAAFLRIEILNLTHYFAKGEVDEIWITFPDPFLENSRIRKRLTSTRYLAAYKDVIKEGAPIHLKTDSTPLFDFSLKSLVRNKFTIEEKTYNVYDNKKLHEDIYIKTDYEKKHLADNRVIKYLRFSYNYRILRNAG